MFSFCLNAQKISSFSLKSINLTGVYLESDHFRVHILRFTVHETYHPAHFPYFIYGKAKCQRGQQGHRILSPEMVLSVLRKAGSQNENADPALTEF